MESKVKIRATLKDIERFFETSGPYFDDNDEYGVLVKYVEYAGGGWWKLVVRHTELDKRLTGKYKSIGSFANAVKREYKVHAGE